MEISLSLTQQQRLTELNASLDTINEMFQNNNDRDAFFKTTEKALIKDNKEKLFKTLSAQEKPLVCQIEENLINWLTTGEGFTQVSTPIIISKTMLDKMTITSEHSLSSQVFWLDNKRCLRPMHAPNLYELMRDIHKVTGGPVKIFEIGPCFRKETQGAQHMSEFTMLNCVEFACVKDGEQMERLENLAVSAMKAVGFDDYTLEKETSTVYGDTIDIVSHDIEIASCSFGPHALDQQWGVFDTWVGIGFGIERIAMAMGGYRNIKRVGRSVTHLNGVRLNI